MKKSFICLGLMVTISFVKGMNSPAYQPTDTQCLRVARYILLKGTEGIDVDENRKNEFLTYQNPIAARVKKHLATLDEDMDKAVTFLKNIPTTKVCNLFSHFKQIDENVANVARLLSESSIVTFIPYAIARNKDIFAAICSASIPQLYNDKGGFFNSSHQKSVQKKIDDIGRFRNSPQKKEQEQPISRDEIIEKLQDMDLLRALSFFRYISQKDIELLAQEYDMVMDTSFQNISPLYREQMNYTFSYEDLVGMTSA